MTREGLQHVTGWLKQLADLTRPGGEPVSRSKLATYAAMLADDFPVAAFTSTSLHSVVEGQEFFPAYDVLRHRLAEWWSQRRPAPALPAPETDWRAERASIEAQCRADWADPANVRASAAKVDACYCRSCQWWSTTAVDRCPDCGGAVGPHPMRATLGKMLGVAVGIHAPDNLAWLPPEFVPGQDAPR